MSGALDDWQCPKCQCRSYAEVHQSQSLVRCVYCKRLWDMSDGGRPTVQSREARNAALIDMARKVALAACGLTEVPPPDGMTARPQTPYERAYAAAAGALFVALAPSAPTVQSEVHGLIELRAKATPGEWDVDSIKNEGDYGSGPNPSSGFNSFAMYAVDALTGKSVALFDTLNSDVIEVEEDRHADEYGDFGAWDCVGKANLEYLAALHNWFDANADRLSTSTVVAPPVSGEGK